MPARLSLRPITGPSRSFASASLGTRRAVCLFCSLSNRPAPSQLARTKRRALDTRRAESTIASPPATNSNPDAREELAAALDHLQKHAANYVNLSRIQLALRNLGQQPGRESIRVAILGMSNGLESGRTAKELLRLLLADPLKPEEDWERQLEDHNMSQPLVLRIAQETAPKDVAIAYARDSLVPEINVSSPPLNGNSLELLFMEVNPLSSAQPSEDIRGLEEAVLVPNVDIPMSNTGRYTPITTPVHKALLVGDGILGAAAVVSLPLLQDRDTITAAIDLKQYTSEDLSGYPFKTVDVDTAGKGLALFRESVSNSMEYEALWFKSKVPAIGEWVKAGVLSNDAGITKMPVRTLVASILQNTAAAVQEAEAEGLSAALSSKVTTSTASNLNRGLSDWAQSAHEELQEQLDTAFTSRKWRRLGWWKLFWRVDDVGMLSSEMIAQRFLPETERGIIYLAGRIQEAGITKDEPGQLAYPGPLLAPLPSDKGSPLQTPTPELEGKWPTHIPFTRNYLLDKTVPALQALAQKLVIQSLSTSTLTTSLGILAYLSSFSAYEAGTVAALGLVWSLRRLQTKWETARSYWEGEVREEGRKAIRAAEASVAQVLDGAKKGKSDDGKSLEELGKIREMVQRAEDALARLK